MLTPQSCDLFKQPFFQFSQLKQYCPEHIEPLKAEYKTAWQIWRHTVGRTATLLGAPFAPPHIERWCNGWQVRAHFFAYFKYACHLDSAAIFSVLLNRRCLDVSLTWHRYRAAQSHLNLDGYRRWTDVFDARRFAGWSLFHADDDEYADRPPLTAYTQWQPRSADDFPVIGRRLERGDIGRSDSAQWIADSILALKPLYEYCHNG